MEATKALKLYKNQKAKEEKERALWRRCISYVNNWVDGELGQWTSDARATLKSQGRPVVSFNEVKKYVNLICGAQRKAKADEKVYPRDSESDPATAEILTDILKYVSDVNILEPERSKIFRDMVTTGRGFERCEWSDALDPLGEVSVGRVNPERVFLTGDIERYDIEDMEAVQEEMPMSKEEAKAQWPDSEEDIDAVHNAAKADDVTVSAGNDYSFEGGIATSDVYDKENEKLIILRTQCKKYKDAIFIENTQTGERKPAEVDGKPVKMKEAKLAAEIMGIQTQVPHRAVKKKIRYVELTYSIADKLLEERESDYQFYDLTAYFGYIDGGRATGIVQDLLDPQDEKNKRHSQIIHILGTAAKNSHFYKQGAVDDPQKVELQLGKVGQFIGVKGNPRDVTAPIVSDLSAVPAIINMDVAATQEMREISGISEASFGALPGGVRSGRALEALKAPTETITSEIFDNFFLSRRISAKKIVAIVQKYYTRERRIRILGDYSSKFVPPDIERQIKTGLVSVEDGMKVITINKMQGEAILNDVTVGRYDVVIDQVEQNPTMRRAQYFDAVNMRGMGAPIPWDLIIRNSDIRGKQEVLARIQEEEEKMLAIQAVMSSTPKTASQSKQVETDLQGNVAGGQF